jgi:uncharacterized FAD-dependent dehydrogenase
MSEVVHNLTIPVGDENPEARLRGVVERKLGAMPGEILEVWIRRRSLDARRGRRQASWVYSVEVWFTHEREEWEEACAQRERQIDPVHPALCDPTLRSGNAPKAKPIVVGSGPAGLFAALTLADHGVPCVILERGKALKDRHLDVRTFRRKGNLVESSNLCFGEGGAGTYSDGKLYTRKHDALVRRVYERLVAFGAPEEILYQAHPHIGTNKLYAILEGIRNHLLERDCEILFETTMQSLEVKDGKIVGVRLDDGELLQGTTVVLATGHSARDVYSHLHDLGVEMVAKSFAIGARCEHPQQLIDEIQLGAVRQEPGVEPAEYFLATKVGERGLYSFCMCPGGFIIPTPTESGHLNVNGMSNSNRGGDFANAALVVTVNPADFYLQEPGDLDSHGVLKGIAFQREWERRAFEAGGGNYHAPAQRLTDLAAGRPSTTLPSRTSYRPGLVASDLTQVLPSVVIESLRNGLKGLDKKMRGYFTDEAVLVGVETTTSTPVRIVRGEDLMAPGFEGLYPTGEGAGYSGGIVSSAIDGIRVARAALG